MNKGDDDTPPRLLLDEHIWAYLAKLLRDQGFDVIHVTEVDLIATPDDQIMAYAVGEHRAVVTLISGILSRWRFNTTKMAKNIMELLYPTSFLAGNFRKECSSY